MRIGIIVHSQTGNTHAVALKIKERLLAAGHAVTVERLKVIGGDKPGGESLRIENSPDAGAYEGLVFGAPVHAFALSRGMEAYLNQIPSLQGRKVACYVTKGLAFHWTGGNQAVSRMRKICESKGAMVCGTGIVVWNKDRDRQTADLAEVLGRCF